MTMRVFDIHVHLYPDALAERAVKSIGDFYKDYTMQGKGTLSDWLTQMEKAGIEGFAAHAVALNPHNAERINDFILECAKDSRLVPFAAIHPACEKPEDFVSRLIDRGFRGVKIHPDIQRFRLDDPDVMPMMKAIAGRLPLLIHCGDDRYDYDGPERVLSLHEKLPELQMICAHLGGWMEWERAAAILPGHGLLLDCSSALFNKTPEEAAEVLRVFGCENVLYGTDYPMWSPSEELKRFMRIPLETQERENILWNNAARLLDL